MEKDSVVHVRGFKDEGRLRIPQVVLPLCCIKLHTMSQAFVKESEGEWLHDVPPTLNALINYLTRENNGVRVYEKSNHFNEKLGKLVHMMSNGFGYAKDDQGKWQIVE